ncbi:DUF7332 family protein [Halohasta litorea]|uniref:Uncharacterized protein n=1 Tax=Halohasta litorea TaxID=869891 RepID=A0ABD6D3X5_9EURY|nr:hypothetical protein [Halohasta litorea]
MVPRTPVIAVVCCLLFLSTPMAAVVGAQTATATADGSTGGTPGGNACFPGEGYEFTIGTEGPEIRMVLHLSLLTNLGGPGAIGIELAGSIDGPPIIELKTGVVFTGIESATEFLNDPFGPFSIAFDYQFELPMFGPGYDYEDTDAPIDGPVGNASCSFTG